MQQHSVLLVQSTEFGWSDLRATLHAMPEVRVIAETHDDQEARALIKQHRPEQIISAARLNNISTVDLLADIRLNHPHTSRFAVFSTHIDPDEFQRFIRLEIGAYLLWSDCTVGDLPSLLHSLIVSNVFLLSASAAKSWQLMHRGRSCLIHEPPRLTGRERSVLRRLGEGMTRENIARQEEISLSTVARSIESLKSKLDADTTASLLIQAALLGLLP